MERAADMVKNESLDAKIGVDAAENESLKVCQKVVKTTDLVDSRID